MNQPRKTFQLILGITLSIAGFLLNGMVWGMKIAHPWNTIILLSGIPIMTIGVILIVLAVTKK